MREKERDKLEEEEKEEKEERIGLERVKER